MTESTGPTGSPTGNGPTGEQPDVTATGAATGAQGAGSGDAAGAPPAGSGSGSGAGSGQEQAQAAAGDKRHHTYYEGGPGASSEPGGEDEYD
ncbi:MAG: hypothetical protein HOQ27_00190, partial [Dermatophilaceae bacterium]|nr:hypothetical protein [Dermatophilaceae bacterium]